jgi:diacylglycerol kinase (ATP)
MEQNAAVTGGCFVFPATEYHFVMRMRVGCNRAMLVPSSTSRTAMTRHEDRNSVSRNEASPDPVPSATAAAFKSKSGLRRVLNATRYSAMGVRAAWRHEAAFRFELVVGVALILAVPWLAPSLMHGALMVGAILFVWCVEMINSAIEALADAISSDVHPLLGRAKDLGSAAVMFSLVLAAVVWGWGLYAAVAARI